jgi:DNA-binding CsgD family transcriptional regulator
MIKSINAQIKNKYLYFTALIGLGFLWTGSAYIVQAYRLLGFLDGGTVNLLVCGAYYVCQAAGIGIVGLLFAKRMALAGGRMLPFCASVVALICTAASLFTPSLAVIIITGALLNIAIGILSGCYLTRLATDIPQQRRGMLFGGAYAFGSIGTWLLSLPMGGRFLWHGGSFLAIAALGALSLLFLRRLTPPPAMEGSGYIHAGLNTKGIWLAAAVLFLLSMENTLGFAFPLRGAADSVYIEFTRIFYGAGLIMAGLVSDRNRRWGAICCLAALAFPFAAMALGSNVTGETVMWVLAYLFLGFWSVYRILVFSDISGKSGLPAFAVLGLLAGRLGEAVGTLGAGMCTGTPLIILSGAVFVLVIVLFFLLYQKLYNTSTSPEEAEKHRQMEYMSRFGLSAREQEIFNLIIQGMSNTEIASALYITESTVKFHAGNIFKKTGLTSRLELIADYKLGDKR